MSQSQSSQRPQRHEALRVFATEFNASHAEFQKEDDVESDNDRAPKYYLLPTGVGANRVLIMGTCTEIDEVGSEGTLRAKVVDRTGSAYVYAGRFSQDVKSTLSDLEPPEHVMVVGKPNTFEGDEGDQYVSINPEEVAVVDSNTRDRWAAEAAEHTLDRLDAFEAGEAQFEGVARSKYDFDYDQLHTDVEAVIEDLASDSESDTDE